MSRVACVIRSMICKLLGTESRCGAPLRQTNLPGQTRRGFPHCMTDFGNSTYNFHILLFKQISTLKGF